MASPSSSDVSGSRTARAASSTLARHSEYDRIAARVTGEKEHSERHSADRRGSNKHPSGSMTDRQHRTGYGDRQSEAGFGGRDLVEHLINLESSLRDRTHDYDRNKEREREKKMKDRDRPCGKEAVPQGHGGQVLASQLPSPRDLRDRASSRAPTAPTTSRAGLLASPRVPAGLRCELRAPF